MTLFNINSRQSTMSDIEADQGWWMNGWGCLLSADTCNPVQGSAWPTAGSPTPSLLSQILDSTPYTFMTTPIAVAKVQHWTHHGETFQGHCQILLIHGSCALQGPSSPDQHLLSCLCYSIDCAPFKKTMRGSVYCCVVPITASTGKDLGNLGLAWWQRS